MTTFQTHTGLVLEWTTKPQPDREDGTKQPDWNEVTLSGERTKLLYEGTDGERAKAVYDETQAHYEARAEAER